MKKKAKKWVPGMGEKYWRIHVNEFCAYIIDEKRAYVCDETDSPYHYVFRTKTEALAALRRVKKALKGGGNYVI